MYTVPVLLFFLLLYTSLSAETLLSVTFDNHPDGLYTKKKAQQDFPGAQWYAGMDEGRGEIVQSIRGKALKVKYPSGCVGSNACAVQIKAVLSKAIDTAFVSYYVMFGDSFQFVKGGKLPGLCGKDCITGGGVSDGTNGWSARLMWRAEGAVVQYVYYPDMNDPNHPGYGEDMAWTDETTQRKFNPGTWHHVVTQIIMNTPSEKNGVIRSWFDGKLSLSRNDISFRTVSDIRIDKFYISTFFGGSDSTWAPKEDMYIYFDEFKVTTDSSEIFSTVNTGSLRRGSNDQQKSGSDISKRQYYTIDGKMIRESILANKRQNSLQYRGVLISKDPNEAVPHRIILLR